MELRDEIERWKKEIGIHYLEPYDTGEIAWAINIGKKLLELEPSKVDEAMLILSNYRLFIAHRMGVLFAHVKYFELNGPRDQLNAQRAKLNIVKPWHDAIEAKIAVLKKIHDRKVKEMLNASGNRR